MLLFFGFYWYDSGMRKDEGVRIITYSLAANLFLFLLKGSVGLMAESPVLKADAVNSAGDVMSSLVVLLGLRYALKPQDEGHHYGHGKMEALVSMVVGIMILVGTGFLLRDVVQAIINCTEAPPSVFALGAAALSIAVKAVMYVKTCAAGKRLHSIAIMTSAKDYKNDIIATSGAVFAIGLAFLGQHLGVPLLLKYSEPVIAAVLSVFIIKSAIEILSESSRMLLDAAPDKETVGNIKKIAAETKGVGYLNWAKARKMGRGLLVDVAIEVDRHISVEAGHGIGDNVKFAIMEQYKEVIDVVVHVNPRQE